MPTCWRVRCASGASGAFGASGASGASGAPATGELPPPATAYQWLLRASACVLVLLMLGGCAHMGHKSLVPEAPPMQIPPPPPVVANGSIFQPARGSRPLFEDQRPRMAGDLLTIVFDEQVSATKNSQTTANRKAEASFTPSVVPGGFGGPGVLNTGLRTLGKLGTDLQGGQDFKGGGGAQANNTFTGTITVTVIQVLNNGNLRVRGEKQIGINQGTEFIRFAGTVDPRTIGADNSILSTRVADARIEYVGNGYGNEAGRMGWLQRFLLKVSPF